jgi:hypothetical protein
VNWLRPRPHACCAVPRPAPPTPLKQRDPCPLRGSLHALVPRLRIYGVRQYPPARRPSSFLTLLLRPLLPAHLEQRMRGTLYKEGVPAH